LTTAVAEGPTELAPQRFQLFLNAAGRVEGAVVFPPLGTE
jgi:hypothetical protein